MSTIKLSNNIEFDIEFNSTPVAGLIKQYLKHLQHVDVPFGYYDNLTYYIQNKDHLLNELASLGKQLNIDVDMNNTSQAYMNELHQHYEQGFPRDKNPLWLEFHDLIHIAEIIKSNTPIWDDVIVNYKHLSGPLEKPFDRLYYKDGVLEIKKGTIFSAWSELGKIPLRYLDDNEPEDVKRVCSLAKPWLMVRAKFHIALNDIKLLPSLEHQQRFESWFSKYQTQWCQHWNLSDWSFEEMFKVIPIGNINNIDQFITEMKQGHKITRVLL